MTRDAGGAEAECEDLSAGDEADRVAAEVSALVDHLDASSSPATIAPATVDRPITGPSAANAVAMLAGGRPA